MKKLKLSQWHDGSVKPVHVGVYERDIPIVGANYARWDGNRWMAWSRDIKLADVTSLISFKQVGAKGAFKWRGIVKDKK
jgi:hypothetical protein